MFDILSACAPSLGKRAALKLPSGRPPFTAQQATQHGQELASGVPNLQPAHDLGGELAHPAWDVFLVVGPTSTLMSNAQPRTHRLQSSEDS